VSTGSVEVKPIEDKMKLLNIAVQEFVTGVAGIEPATFAFGERCSAN
jgi:DNA-directed RNA polymerase subunit K/omega